MDLISVRFALFVCVTAAVYFLFPKKYRWTVLLAASWAYYLIICNRYILYMLVTTVTTWLGGRAISAQYARRKETLQEHKAEWGREEKKRYKAGVLKRCRLLLAAVLLLNFGILGVLKYSGFVLSIVQGIGNLFGAGLQLPDPGFLLPLGISFYTFQSMGYLIDVYNEKTAAERSLARFALFVSFFPQIIQGPIAVYDDLAHQLYEGHDFSLQSLKSGCTLVLWGAFKKLVVADRAVKLVSYITADSTQFTGTMILIAALAYALQLYADFSGGIDLVRGIAEVFGIEMAENFRRPYFSMSLTEYWHRWHITLGSWVRSYVFYPLSISPRFLNMGRFLTKKCGKHLGKVIPTSLASLLTFLIIGIWHGANGKYVAFGLWNGLVIMLIELCRPVNERVFTALHVNKEGRLYKLAAMAWTFLLVLVGYYFDIARSFSDAMQMLWRSVADFHLYDLLHRAWIKDCGLTREDYIAIVFGALVMLAADIIQEKTGRSIRELLRKRKTAVRWIFLWIAILCVVVLGYYGPTIDPSAFVYMQF